MAPGPFSSTGSFFVRDKSTNKLYPATFLTYADGTPMVDEVLESELLTRTGDPNKPPPYRPGRLTLHDKDGNVVPNPNNYLVVPSADYMNEIVRRGREYGELVRSSGISAPGAPWGFLLGTFAPKVGYGDAQYQGVDDEDRRQDSNQDVKENLDWATRFLALRTTKSGHLQMREILR